MAPPPPPPTQTLLCGTGKKILNEDSPYPEHLLYVSQKRSGLSELALSLLPVVPLRCARAAVALPLTSLPRTFNVLPHDQFQTAAPPPPLSVTQANSISVHVHSLLRGYAVLSIQTKQNKLHGLSPRANYTNRATAASRRSGCQLLRIKGATWSA
jgi:hypothetical protein